MTTTPTSGAADLPEALTHAADLESFADMLPAYGFESKPLKEAAATIRRLHALAAGQATAAQAVAEPADTVVLNAAMRAIQQAIELIGAPTDEHMRAVRRVLRGAVIVAEDDGKVAPLPSTAYAALPDEVVRLAQVAIRECQYKGNDMPQDWMESAMRACRLIAAPQPSPKAQEADSVQEDAALWHWLAEYLVGTRTDLDDEIVASETVNDLRKLVEAAIKQGENHDHT